MKKIERLMFLPILLSLVMNSCGINPTAVGKPETEVSTAIKATSTTPTNPTGRTIIVTSAVDSGLGSLRQAMLDARPGDNITFDSKVFPPDSPVTINFTSSLPELNQGYLTIDGSEEGVILNGSQVESGHGLSISSDGNIIRGLQIVNFPDAGIGIFGGAQNNIIGGDRELGTGALGQGNLISGNGNFGIGLWNEGTSENIIQGNYIGVNLDASKVWGHPRDGIHSNGANGNNITGNVIGGNDTGVYLCCVKEGNNVVTDNFIGTDPTGEIPLGNRTAGVLVDRSNNNIIGPSNLIAHNEGPGVMFWDGTEGNTVTNNLIRENGQTSRNQAGTLPPLVINFDLEAGSISGVTCPDCIVEIFSDTGNEGGIYEGQTIADVKGMFTYDKEKGFIGPHLTATTTNLNGTTSNFSLSTEGTSRNLNMQLNNDNLISSIKTRPSSELADNHIGGGAESQHVGDWVWETGLKWMRVIIDPYGKWQQVNWSKSDYSIDPNEEMVINDLIKNDVKIMIVLDIWHLENKVNNYKSQIDVANYLSWVRWMVHHFKGRIDYYEILNEPDLSFEMPSGMPVNAYVDLVKGAISVIREEDPNTKIVVGAVPDLRFDSARDWMFELLNSEIIPLVDGISWHPMYGAAPSEDLRGIRESESPQMTDYWENYPELVKKIKNIANSNGFQGEFLVEEMLWRTPAYPHESEPYGFTDISAAKYYARAIVIHLGLNVAPGLAVVQADDRPRSHSVIQKLSTIMAGLKPIVLPFEIESKANQIKNYGFSVDDGVKYLALWSDGVAMDEDPGVPSTVILKGFSGWTATGIDVLNGFEQELYTRDENGNLVIQNFLIKDYPIIIRLEPKE